MQIAPLTKPAHYNLAREAIMMAYTLLCPEPISVLDLKNHLCEMKSEILPPSSSLDIARTLFFEAFDALAEGLKGKWFVCEP